MIAGKLLTTLYTFLVLVVMMMLVTYVTRLRVKMSRVMSEHLNLFDGMEEGLIVLAENDQNIQFATKPAIHIL